MAVASDCELGWQGGRSAPGGGRRGAPQSKGSGAVEVEPQEGGEEVGGGEVRGEIVGVGDGGVEAGVGGAEGGGAVVVELREGTGGYELRHAGLGDAADEAGFGGEATPESGGPEREKTGRGTFFEEGLKILLSVAESMGCGIVLRDSGIVQRDRRKRGSHI